MGKFDDIINKLNIDETLTKAPTRQKTFNKVKNNVNLTEDYNFMADVLFLPETKEHFKYLLVVVDIATDEFDIEPIKNKEPETILKSMKTIFTRKHLNKPYASIATDSGTEFKGVFQKYLYNESIFHKVSLPNRHTQMTNVENLNKTLGRLLNGYMNSK